MPADNFGREQVDLTNCDREPIHRLGHVQPFSRLMAFASDGTLRRASTNVERLFGKSVDALVGTPMETLLGAAGARHMHALLALAGDADLVERGFELKLLDGGMAVDDAAAQHFDCALHRSGEFLILEIEESLPWDFGDPSSFVRSLMTKLDGARDTEDFLATGAQLVRQVTGFDRVMVYRFHEDGHGEVAAEAAGPGIDSFLGLHYPASDIPRQARELYVRNPFRIIADVGAAPVPLAPEEEERTSPLDLSLSVSRAVSPIHIEYLGNMGVEASLSISIIVEGRLWGLFACHHNSPRLPSFKERTMAELFSQMFSLKLESRLRAELAEREHNMRAAGDRLMAKIASNSDRLRDAAFLAPAFEEMMAYDGIAVLFDGDISIHGATPPPGDIPQIARRIGEKDLDQGVMAVNCLAGIYRPARDYAEQAAGMLAISISRRPGDYVLLFRREMATTIEWAGNPEKPVESGPHGDRLTPRGSFELFREEVRGCGQAFSETEQYLARTLRSMLLEVVLRVTDAAREASRINAERQELLIGELNHRVRNILALIRGIVRQSRGTAASAEEYIDMLQGRIEAMARAHDQITQDNWSPASLARLIETEASAYLQEKARNLNIEGEDVLLVPTAFTTMALVFHELMTNSAKYGALSDSGCVDIRISTDDAGDVRIRWTEKGGPPVKPPSRTGFGTTILERTVPHDLGGKAALHFNLSGLVAEFCIPARHCVGTKGGKAVPAAAPAGAEEAPAANGGAPARVLVVEDNLIVAMDCEQMLLDLGVQSVEMASSSDQAFTSLEVRRPDYALLDFNLGQDSSTRIAERLREMGVPFCFATGYGDQIDLPDALVGTPVLQKPFDISQLRAVLVGHDGD